MYVVRSKQGQKVAAFRTKRAAEVFVRVRSGRRPASARSPGGLPVGRSIFTSHLKIHHYRGALAITDLTNAGKRGAKVSELHVTGRGGLMSDGVLGSLAEDILPMTYAQARAYLEQFAEGGQLAGARGTEAANRWLHLSERTHRGIDVERAATAIEIHNSFPNGSQIEISSCEGDPSDSCPRQGRGRHAAGHALPTRGLQRAGETWRGRVLHMAAAEHGSGR